MGLLFTGVIAVCIIGVSFSGNFYLLVGLLFIAGGSDALVDVGLNVHALRVQKAYGRSINNSFHAIWSIGAVAGNAAGALAITLGIPRPAHLFIAALAVMGAASFIPA